MGRTKKKNATALLLRIMGEALLASALLGDGELNGLVEGVCGMGMNVVKKKEEGALSTGVKSLDDALCGGVAGGSVVCVSGEGMGGSEVSNFLSCE